jgi:pSer/pThr/pTyr-binding forkhead associated (FHA) protein
MVEPEKMPASLIFTDGREFPLAGDTTIGREDDNTLILLTKSVSRHHARLRNHDGRWFIEDRGSYNGTFVNDVRVQPGTQVPLRHADRLVLGSAVLVFSCPLEDADIDRTESLEPEPAYVRSLSPLQQQVVHCLCQRWLHGGSLEELPSNEEIAAMLGTPGATETVKAALRRTYAKAGLSEGAPHAKRRALCRIARERGWI